MPNCSSVCGYANRDDRNKPEVCLPSSPSQKESEIPGGAIVIMGVSGAGKTTIGKLLAETIKSTFLDADDFHSESNKEKMSKGIPLTDYDRTPWLESLRDTLSEYMSRGKIVVLSCSALRKKYRQILRSAAPNYQGLESNTLKCDTCQVKFVLLDVPAELLAKRLCEREAEGQHFMPSTLLKSQLDLLQIDETEGVIRVDGTKSVFDVVSYIRTNVCIPLLEK